MIEPRRELRRQIFWRRIAGLTRRYGRLELSAVITGVVAGLSAVALDEAIELFRELLEFVKGRFTAGPLDLGLILAPAIGGLISGVITWKMAPEVKGHGIPNVIESFLFKEGRIALRVPIARILASGALIGLGGSAGREGPIGQVGAGFGSSLAGVLKMPSRPRKLLLIAGLSAGIAAAFDAPLGGVLFGLEILLGAVYSVELIPAFVSAISAVAVSWTLRGAKPVIAIPAHVSLPNPMELLVLLAFGLAMAIVARAWVDILYFFEDGFEAWRIPEWVKPVIGGLATGVIGFWSLGWGIMGPGFDGLNRILAGEGTLALLLTLAFVKIFATSLSVGSGGSGGIFTPTLFIGAAIGTVLGRLLNAANPTLFPEPELFALAGMAAHFAAATRAPLTAVVIITELGRNYKLIPSLLAVCATSYFFSLVLMESTIYTRRLEERGKRVPIVGLSALERLKVRDIMVTNIVSVSPETTLQELHDLMLRTHHMGFPVVDERGRLVGMVAFSDLRRAHPSQWSKIRVREVMNREPVTVTPEESVQEALEKMLRFDVGRLPVVADRKLIGLLTRTDIVKAYEKALLMKDLEEAAAM